MADRSSETEKRHECRSDCSNRDARVVAVAGARRIESDRQRGCRWKMLLMRRAR